MINIKSGSSLIFLIVFFANTLCAQHAYNLGSETKLRSYQDSLIGLAIKTNTVKSDIERYESNAGFIKTLVNSLKTPGSYTYDFDSLKQISIVRSPDNLFRIFSWQIPLSDGTYRFFGTIQMATPDGKLKLFPLIDATDNITDVNEITDSKKWYGTRYYEIVPIINKGKSTYYVLLGWKGHNQKTSKKVLDIMTFDKERVVFGKSVFEEPKTKTVKNRIVFEYNKLNSMTLRLDKKVGMIVFDHLAPFDPEMKGNFEYYASDSSFDGYKVYGDKLRLVENVELKNDPNEMDELYIDPAIKNTPAPNKLEIRPHQR